ncbi:UNVERIFIED_CONTAM: DsbA family protein, partial [Pseudomonas aeruginosa]
MSIVPGVVHSLYGDAKARWTINEYADLECPFCKVYTPRLKRWVDSHTDVNLVWRHLPLQSNRPPNPSPRFFQIAAWCAPIFGGHHFKPLSGGFRVSTAPYIP